jgi:hypothetical protein
LDFFSYFPETLNLEESMFLIQFQTNLKREGSSNLKKPLTTRKDSKDQSRRLDIQKSTSKGELTLKTVF